MSGALQLLTSLRMPLNTTISFPAPPEQPIQLQSTADLTRGCWIRWPFLPYLHLIPPLTPKAARHPAEIKVGAGG